MRKTFFICVISVVLSYGLALAQVSEKAIYQFSGFPDGASPAAKLLFDTAGNLYGTTEWGGASNTLACKGCGTVFELSPTGTGGWTEAVLYNFCQNFDGSVCQDGEEPTAGLITDSLGNLYGTTSAGGGDICPIGGGGCGTVFELSPPSNPGGPWTYALLYQFCQTGGGGACPDGAKPVGDLVFDSSGNLYGTTEFGGINSEGTVFELSSTGNGTWTEVALYSFCSIGSWPVCPDGYNPKASVTLDGSGNIYGTTTLGGSSKSKGGGVVYKLAQGSTGWTETVVAAFPAPGGLDGAVSLFNGHAYTTNFEGGAYGLGGVFQVSLQGHGTAIASFNGTNGASPAAGLLVNPRNGNLFGTTSGEFYDNLGTVFRVAGKQVSVLHHFAGAPSDGAEPLASVIADKQGHLYGTTVAGGVNNQGVVFEITP